MTLLVLGKNGQLGGAFSAKLGSKARLLGIEDANLLDPNFTQKLDPSASAVINAAAYTAVDKAQADAKAAFRINAEAVGELAQWCKSHNLPLVHYSTDYVFDGSGSAPGREDDPTGPLNVYGQSKLAGEQAIAAAGGRHLIFRTSWVYDAHGKNFFNAMLKLFAEKETLNVVSDQIGAPTYAPHLAAASLAALENALAMEIFPSGVYHVCNSGETSWHEFAERIFALARSRDSVQKFELKCQQINPIPTTHYPAPAARPLNSRLDCRKAREILGVVLPPWQQGLKECFEEKYGNRTLPYSGAADPPPETA